MKTAFKLNRQSQRRVKHQGHDGFRLLGLLLMVLGLFALMTPASYASGGTAKRFQSASQNLIDAGVAAMKAENFDAAQKKFEAALIADPANMMALIGLGDVYRAMGDRRAGMDYYRRVLDIEPYNLAAIKAESLIYLANDGLVKALDNLELLKRLCADQGCEEMTSVAKAIDHYKARYAEGPEAAPDPGTESEAGPDAGAGDPQNP
ncbi:cellulose synthase subunit BcsC [alpha proteobacterium Q-1]|nr:cellulose synthase subunit BcsC [alpha proteobacterium Q-1]